jgi:hypothetical protein
MTRTRSEYRLSPITVGVTRHRLEARHPLDADRDSLATLLLDGYRNTIDDEGEDIDEAYAAIDNYLARIARPHSYVAVEQSEIIAFAFVVVVDTIHYIDPVVVATTRRQRGLGRAIVELCLESLAVDGLLEVGATITDGNVASERLFTGLGFSRRGAW